MKLAVVAWHRPEPEGTPTGRCLYAFGEGLVAEGHEVAMWSWTRQAPTGPLPEWCEWHHLPPEPAWKTRARALWRPLPPPQLVFRAEMSDLGWLGPAKNWIALGILVVVLVGIASERIHRMWCAMIGAGLMVRAPPASVPS